MDVRNRLQINSQLIHARGLCVLWARSTPESGMRRGRDERGGGPAGGSSPPRGAGAAGPAEPGGWVQAETAGEGGAGGEAGDPGVGGVGQGSYRSLRLLFDGF